MKIEDFSVESNDNQRHREQKVHTVSNTSKERQQINLRIVLKCALFIFIPLTILVGSIMGAFYYTNVEAERRITEAAELNAVELQKGIIINNFKSIVSDIAVLSQYQELKSLFEGSYGAKDRLANEFLTLSKGKRCYDQIRYLDETGMEVVIH